jgi:hypothetical protein
VARIVRARCWGGLRLVNVELRGHGSVLLEAFGSQAITLHTQRVEPLAQRFEIGARIE